jgi:hypothetical protein
MRDGRAARPWLRQPQFSVCPWPGLNARSRARPCLAPLPRRGRRQEEPNPPGRKCKAGLRRELRAGLPCNPRAGRKPASRSVRPPAATPEPRPDPPIRLPLRPVEIIRARRIWDRALPVPLIRGIGRLFKAHRATWATGLTSIAIFPCRSRNGRCAATPASGDWRQANSSG